MDFKELLGNLSKASVCLWVNSGILRESEGVRMERYTPEEKQEKTRLALHKKMSENKLKVTQY